MPLRIVFFILVSLLVFPAPARSFQGFVQPFGENASIAWGNGEIVVVRMLEKAEDGESEKVAPLAVRKAAMQARKQMLDMILSIRIDSKRTVSAFLSGDDELAVRVRGSIQNSPFKRPSVFDESGGVRVSEILRGKLAELVLPTTIQFQSGIQPRLSTSMEQSLAFSDAVPEVVGSGADAYTGLIIDARGLKVTPALAPVVYGQDGLGAYGAFLISRKNAIDNGVVAYATSSDPVVLRERVGSRPLMVKALTTYGSWRTDLIISSPMARLVRAVMRPGDIVDKCRVVIVVDAPISLENADVIIEGEIQPNEEQ
jgi:hypothetical protein